MANKSDCTLKQAPSAELLPSSKHQMLPIKEFKLHGIYNPE